MKRLILLLLIMCLGFQAYSQVKSSFKDIKRTNSKYPSPKISDFDFSAFNGLPRAENPFKGLYFSPNQIKTTKFSGVFEAGFTVKKDPINGLPIMIEGKIPNADQVVSGKVSWKSKSTQYLNKLKDVIEIVDPENEFKIVSVQEDELKHTHIRLQQYFGKLEVYGGEIVLHSKDNSIYLMNGRYYPTPELELKSPTIDKEKAKSLALENVRNYTKVVEIPKHLKSFVAGPQAKAQLVVYHEKMDLHAEHMAWKVELVPNLSDHWSYFIDAHTGEILDSYNQTCKFFHDLDESCLKSAAPEKSNAVSFGTSMFDGGRTANGPDLNGVNRSINVYEIGSDFIMLDVSQPMFDAARSNIPQDVVGGIITLDASNTSPQTDNFQTTYVGTSNINSWNANGISAHFNAITSYRYFLNTFNRNSINGQGGTVYSIINVTDENNEAMDNAFWNGIAMFYGNGKDAFSEFAGSLDVGGHEMSHGVIQNSAGLEYVSQSGALNESFADIFGVMIERENWQLGEDIVNTQFFPTGALRDMSNPNNGGSGPGDFRWQPKDMSEFQNLDPTPEQDNGGVHINSGIPNRAYYLFATANGMNVVKAEQVFYRALTQYLTRTSQFIDLRNAVIQSAQDIHGANSTEVNAAINAFNTVGITAGQSTPDPEPVPTNTGDELILFTNHSDDPDQDNTSLFLFSTAGNALVNPFQNIPGPLRPPSITDDGSFIIYVAKDNTIWGIEIDWETGDVTSDQINESTIWGNVSISKDGSRLAATTNDGRNSIFVIDINSGGLREFELFNPTFTEGISTGDVVLADVLQWDFTGEFIMYDALNRISNFSGDIEYWDIGFLNVWNNQINNFGNGSIEKLFNGLSGDLSVGNPSFSKNSPNIIVLDVIDEFNDEYLVYGVDIQTGDQATIFNNNKAGVPNYSVDDSYMIFDVTNGGEEIIASINLQQDKIRPNGNATIFFDNPGSFGLKWGIIFSNGTRNFTPTNTNEEIASELALKLFPNPVGENFTLSMELEESSDIQLEVFDMLGRRVKAANLGRQSGQFQQTIEVNELAPATYLLRLKVGTHLVTSKFVKK